MNNSKNSDLNKLQVEIDQIDLELAELLKRRLALSSAAAGIKNDSGMPIGDGEQEEDIIERVSQSISAEKSKNSILKVLRYILEESADYQISTLHEKKSPVSNPDLFPSICIIGSGLIGGALSRHIKSVIPQTRLLAIDLPEKLASLKESGIFEDCSAEPGDLLDNSCSLVVLACPPATSLEMLSKVAPLLSPGQIVIDLCSVKQAICSLAEETNLNGAEFVGAHPFFGTEKSGFENSAAIDISGKTFCLVPTEKSSQSAIDRLTKWALSLNMQVMKLEPRAHDETCALTSHLIQLIAAAMGDLINETMLESGKSDRLALSGGALASLARLMSSPPELWEQITFQNRIEIQNALKKLADRIEMLAAGAGENSEIFRQSFSNAHKVRALLKQR